MDTNPRKNRLYEIYGILSGKSGEEFEENSLKKNEARLENTG